MQSGEGLQGKMIRGFSSVIDLMCLFKEKKLTPKAGLVHYEHQKGHEAGHGRQGQDDAVLLQARRHSLCRECQDRRHVWYLLECAQTQSSAADSDHCSSTGWDWQELFVEVHV